MISLHEGQGARGRKAAERVFQLHLKVAGCEPPIWRRLLVRESMWLSRLHDAIQAAFDWYDYQTHVFTVGERRLGNPSKGEAVVVEDDRDIVLSDLDLEPDRRLTYDYNFDEGWRVDIFVERSHSLKRGGRYPKCVEGVRAGPPEDCGGKEAYQDMLASIAEPNTSLGREWLEWLGPDYNPEVCDLPKINKALRKLGSTE